jgi:sulfotransferase
MTQFHFIAGLPRSGSTLLAAILRQNPAITASMSSPVGGIFLAMQRAISRGNEAAMFLTDGQREALLRSVFDECYLKKSTGLILGADIKCGGYGADGVDLPTAMRNFNSRVIFDTNRMWPSKLPTLVRLFPDCRVVCCVRRVAWIMDSIESLLRRNHLELSGIFGFEPGGTVYSRVASLGSSNGLVGFALDALREGFYGEHHDRMLLVEYEALAKYPRDTIDAIYDWLKLPRFDHDYEHIEQIPGAAEFDEKLGTPGLHSVRGKVEWRERATILPPELFASFPPAFWRSNNPNVPVIHCDESRPNLRSVA